jgi:lantibiotic modifying enzyme
VPPYSSLPLRRLVAAASTLSERRDGPYEAAGGRVGLAEARLARWRDRVAGGDPQRFGRRLRWDGWSEERARAVLGGVRLRDGAPLPAWAGVLDEAWPELHRPVDAAGGGPGADPLEGLLRPFVAVARGRLATAVGSRYAPVEPAALAGLERALLRTLAADCGPAVAVELAALAAVAPRQGEDADARVFAEWVRSGGLPALLLRLPVLARRLSVRVEYWVEATAELVRRTAADLGALAGRLGGGAALGRVVAAEAGLSDPHRRGRTVTVLTFASGVRVVYKPRPLGAEAAFHALLEWLEARGAAPPLRPLAVLDRGAYGWSGYAQAAPCPDPAAAARFHERAGMLLCLAHALGGGDLHAGNVLACGELPVLVDLEVLFGVPLEQEAGSEAALPGAYALWNSVLCTRLLPYWSAGGKGEPARREGGLGPIGAAELEPLRAGFARMYRLLVRWREELLAPGGPLEAFAACRVRAVLRPTRLYSGLLDRLRHPRYLADGVEGSLEVEALCSRLLHSPEPPPGWAAFRAERDDLEALDVPVFSGGADALQLRGSRGENAGPLRRRKGYREARRRLREMDEAGLQLQLDLIRGAVVAGPSRPAAPGPDPELPADAALAEAKALADELARLALERGGRLEWVGVVPAPDARASRLGRAGLSLAHGSAGIALFLALCCRETGCDAHRGAALRALAPLLAAPPARADGLGLGTGMGGRMYALARISGFLADEAPLRAALALAEGVTDGRVAADPEPGVVRGVAGALLGLLALHDVSGDVGALERARACGRHLQRHRPWTGRIAAGFAHGASGIGHALARLHRATGDATMLHGALEAFAAARAANAGAEAPPAPDLSWRTGAAGCALARMAAADLPGGAGRDPGLAAALDALEHDRRPMLDSLSSGTFGGIEALLVAGTRLGEPARHAAALRRAADAVRRSRRRGTFALGIDGAFAPGLLEGTAGIGYQLLRLHDPDRVPSLLLWE